MYVLVFVRSLDLILKSGFGIPINHVNQLAKPFLRLPLKFGRCECCVSFCIRKLNVGQ